MTATASVSISPSSVSVVDTGSVVGPALDEAAAAAVVVVVVALYDYTATQPNQLCLREGDSVLVLQCENSGWWSGVDMDGRSGWFPASYVERTVADETILRSFRSLGTPLSQEATQSSHPADIVASSAEPGAEEVVVPCSPPSSPVEDWAKYYTDDGQLYFVHRFTGESRWSLPSGVSEDLNPTQSLIYDTSFDSGFQDVSAVQLDTAQAQSSPGQQFTFASASPRFSLHARTGKDGLRHRLSVAGSTSSSRSKAVASQENGRYGYLNNFWSDKGDKSGFDVLVAKHRNGKEVCKDLAQMMEESKARIEEAYAKALLDLAKCPLGDRESGTAKTAWNQVKFDMETQARARLEFANKLSKEVEQPIMNFKNEQKKTRKNYEATIAADRRVLVSKYACAMKMQKIYQLRAKDAEQAESLVAKNQGGSMVKRELQKLEDAAKKERKRASIAALDYRTAVEEYERIRCQWEDDMLNACYEFQSAEEGRIEFLKTILRQYLKVQKDVNQTCKESSEMVENSIEAVSKEVDIEMFVKSNFTGSQKPIPLRFEQIKNYA